MTGTRTDEAAGLAAKVEAGALSTALKFVSGSISRKETVPILRCVRLTVDGARLAVAGTNLDQQAEMGVLAAEPTPGAVCVDGHRLAALVARFKGEVSIEMDELLLSVRGAGGHGRLPTLPAKDFPALGAPEVETELTLPRGGLLTAVGSVRHAAGDDPHRYYINGVCLQRTDDGIVAIATEGHRMAVFDLEVGDLPACEEIIIPRAALADLMSAAESADAEVTLTFDRDKLRLAHGPLYFQTKLIDGSFPDWRRVMPRAPGTEHVVPVKAFAEAVKTAMVASADKSNAVKFEPAEGVMLCSGRGQFGQACGEVEAVDVAPGEVFGMNGKYVVDALARLEAETVSLTVTDPGSAIRFEAGDGLHQCIMPLRVG